MTLTFLDNHEEILITHEQVPRLQLRLGLQICSQSNLVFQKVLELVCGEEK